MASRRLYHSVRAKVKGEKELVEKKLSTSSKSKYERKEERNKTIRSKFI